MGDTYLKKHPTSYFDNQIIASEESALNLMRKYSIHPPDNADGQKGSNLGTANYKGKAIRLGKMHTGMKVAKLHFSREARSHYRSNEGSDTLYGNASYLDNAPGFPTWWLPWDEGGAIIGVRIPRKGTSRDSSDPDRFFTAGINGCSIFFEGTPSHPIIYHAGGSTGVDTASGSASFWSDIMDVASGNYTGEVNKTDYITRDDTRDSLNRKTSQAAKDYETWLRNNSSSSLEISQVDPWACVMGIRDGAGNWKFYLQENATVTYVVLKKQSILSKTMVRQQEPVWSRNNDGTFTHKFLNGEYKYQARKRAVSRPIQFREVWPNNDGGAIRINRSLPKAKHG